MASLEQEWVSGKITLGSAAAWSADEIRLVTELGYSLAQQGRNIEAIAIFEGLSALTPSTHYFDSALGALWLRESDFEKSVRHLDLALESDPEDVVNRVNRAESLIHLGETKKAKADLDFAVEKGPEGNRNSESLTRAKALLATLDRTDKA